jgi:hypothetical protein
MNAVYPFQKSPRCSATSKRTRRPCMAPAVTGWTVCRFHGARGGGPKGKRIEVLFLFAIMPDESQGEPPLLPLLNRTTPIGSTADVAFNTTRACYVTQFSHINMVVGDTAT